ncbi:MAG: serine/threonine protein kinase [Deltaproteobacteria bacterium]|nr:serine/threonine protein kinase [Deltaproteobacteria bacterium]
MARGKAPNLARRASSSAGAAGQTQIRENLGARHRRETDELFRTRLLTAAMFGAILSPLFGVVDFLAAQSWRPELPLAGFLVLRFGITLWFVALWVFLRAARRLPVAAMDWLIFAPPGLALGYMTAATGGTASPYVAGTTLLVMARTILVPGPAMKHIPVVSFLVLSYPITCFLFGPAGGDYRAWFGNADTMGYLAANLFPLFAIAGVGLVASDMIHAMHQRLISARSLGRYKIKKELGRGAMGVVYLAWHRDLGRPCVIKIVNPDRDTSGALRRRFEREARETSLLRSPYTVQVFDFGVTQQGQLFYVMEYLEGLSLQEQLDKMGPQEFSRVCRWVCYACESLAEAHTRDLIHRDIKPDNLFLASTADGREVVKVLDFGIARKVTDGNTQRGDRGRRLGKTAARMSNSDANLTAVGTVMGTPLYVAPEVLEGGGADHRADQYSLAASAYHLLTGRPVFLASTMEELLWKTMEEPPEPPSLALEPGKVPKGLDGILIRALSKDPDRRYSSMEQFRLALEPFASAPGASTVPELSPFTEP